MGSPTSFLIPNNQSSIPNGLLYQVETRFFKKIITNMKRIAKKKRRNDFMIISYIDIHSINPNILILFIAF